MRMSMMVITKALRNTRIVLFSGLSDVVLCKSKYIHRISNTRQGNTNARRPANTLNGTSKIATQAKLTRPPIFVSASLQCDHCISMTLLESLPLSNICYVFFWNRKVMTTIA